LLQSAKVWGLDAAARYHRLMLAVFEGLSAMPLVRGSKDVPGVPGVRAYHLRLGGHFLPDDQRVGQPRHLVVYREAPDGVVEIIGLAHDRMLLGRAAERMQRDEE
jgi:toxin ParE1/3/4